METCIRSLIVHQFFSNEKHCTGRVQMQKHLASADAPSTLSMPWKNSVLFGLAIKAPTDMRLVPSQQGAPEASLVIAQGTLPVKGREASGVMKY